MRHPARSVSAAREGTRRIRGLSPNIVLHTCVENVGCGEVRGYGVFYPSQPYGERVIASMSPADTAAALRLLKVLEECRQMSPAEAADRGVGPVQRGEDHSRAERQDR